MRCLHESAALLSGASVFLNLENGVIDLSSLLCSSPRELLGHRLGQTVCCLVAAGLGPLAPVQPPWPTHSPSPSRMKAPFKHPPPLPLRFALKFPIVCLLKSNASSLAQSYSNWFLAVLGPRCYEQGLLSRCGAWASPVVEHGF